MAKIIYCDFRRTERRKEMNTILDIFMEIINSFQDPTKQLPNLTEDELTQLNNQYVVLEKEEMEWGNYPYYK